MKTAFLAVAIVAIGSWSYAATLETYTASNDPSLNPDANSNTVDAWTVSHSGGGAAGTDYGSFLGNSANNGGGSGAGAGTSAWGIWAGHSYGGATGDNEIDMGHTFDGGALTIGQTVSIDFDGAYADASGANGAPSNGEYGIRLFGPGGFVFALVFSGGDTYRYYDGSANDGTAAGPGYDPNGFNFAFTLTSTNGYSAVIKDGSGILGSWTGTVSGGTPDFIQVYSKSAGTDGANGGDYGVFSNNLSIVPEPSSLALIGAGAALFLGFRRRTQRSS